MELTISTLNCRIVEELTQSGIKEVDDGTNSWSKGRMERFQNLILSNQTHILNLQEFQRPHEKALRTCIAQYSLPLTIILGRSFSRSFEPPIHNAIVYDKSALQCLLYNSFFLGENIRVSSFDYDSSSIRGVTLAVFKIDDIIIVSVCTHFDWIAPTCRLNQAKTLTQTLNALIPKKATIILSGDFNGNPDEAFYHHLRENGFVDYTQDHNIPTFHKFKGIEYNPRLDSFNPLTQKPDLLTHPDLILIRDPLGKLTQATCTIVTDGDEQKGLYASDHRMKKGKFIFV